MTVRKVTVSLDPAVAERALQDVADGRAKSLSAWLNEAGRERAEREDLAALLAEILDETGGPLTDEERAVAKRRLAEADRQLEKRRRARPRCRCTDRHRTRSP